MTQPFLDKEASQAELNRLGEDWLKYKNDPSNTALSEKTYDEIWLYCLRNYVDIISDNATIPLVNIPYSKKDLAFDAITQVCTEINKFGETQEENLSIFINGRFSKRKTDIINSIRRKAAHETPIGSEAEPPIDTEQSDNDDFSYLNSAQNDCVYIIKIVSLINDVKQSIGSSQRSITTWEHNKMFFTGYIIEIAKGSNMTQTEYLCREMEGSWHQHLRNALSEEFIGFVYTIPCNSFRDLSYIDLHSNDDIFNDGNPEPLRVPLEHRVYAKYEKVTEPAITQQSDKYKEFMRSLLKEPER